jgi:hypothetical protein
MPRVLANRYQLSKRLGEGGQGRVYRGQDLVTKATVAIKLMEQGSSPECLERFKLEGRLAARIRDPHLVAALHFGESEGQHFIVFDYIPGVMPVTTMFDQGRIEAARVCDLALQVLDALATLHGAGVVHQDVSPANCLWRERETGRLEVFLVDLGSASTRTPVTGASVRDREPGGTAYYTAPEMAEGQDWDHRVDLWSVGALMYVLLTGCEVDIGTPDEPLGIPPPVVLVPTIPQAVSDVVMRALASANHRYPSATDMAEAVRKALPGRERPARAGIPGRTALGGMAFAAVVAVFGTITAQRALGTTSVPSNATEHAPVTQPAPPVSAPAPVELSFAPPVPAPASAVASVTTLPERAPAPSTVPAKSKQATWEMVKRVVKRQAPELAPCSEDEFISLGLHISGGRALLATVDGKPVSDSDHHRCAREVVGRLRFPGGELQGVVGVPLPLD